MLNENEDFPAAHSMDTDWFAVDGEGHVALMASGESGAVPINVRDQEAGMTFIQDLAAKAGSEVWKHGLVRGRHCHKPDEVPKEWDYYNTIFFLRRHPRDIPALKSSTFVNVSSFNSETEGTLFPGYCDEIESDAYLHLHHVDLCAGCAKCGHESMANLGLFQFNCDEYGTSPYTRVVNPSRPLHISELPAPIQELLQTLTLASVNFAEMQKIQPIEHVQCETWGADSFVGTDGNVHPLPK